MYNFEHDHSKPTLNTRIMLNRAVFIDIYTKPYINTFVQIDFPGEAVAVTLDGSTDFVINSQDPSASVNIIVSHSSSLKQIPAQSNTDLALLMLIRHPETASCFS